MDLGDQLKSSTPSKNLSLLIDKSVVNNGFDFSGILKLISYAQMYAYSKEGKGNILTINKANNTFSVTKGPEDFANQVGKTVMPTKALSVASDDQTASFHYTAADQK